MTGFTASPKVYPAVAFPLLLLIFGIFYSLGSLEKAWRKWNRPQISYNNDWSYGDMGFKQHRLSDIEASDAEFIKVRANEEELELEVGVLGDLTSRKPSVWDFKVPGEHGLRTISSTSGLLRRPNP